MSTDQTAPVFKHAVTEDDMSGRPWPPNEPGLWAVARRLPKNFTLWRQISISPKAKP